MSAKQCLSKIFESILLVVDVHFQQSYRPTGRFNDVKKYYSFKHWDYGLKTQTLHYLDGALVHSSPHYPGNTHDFEIFKKHISKVNRLLRKTEEETDQPDEELLSEEYPELWAILGDKAYTGGDDYTRMISIMKENQMLTNADQRRNRALSRERVIIENYYGRMLMLWGIIKKIYTYEHDSYDTIFSVCGSLTNYHMIRNPLRAEEGDFYKEHVANQDRKLILLYHVNICFLCSNNRQT
ncbi:hypothetical protein AKO1_006255 [Acrasis kona]|uniref:DDE Tnp4 domain-containing protein n=1 Tax=Acrasis kona TaxID=1008807 RepID=A0AAW2YGX5_9EUKA